MKKITNMNISVSENEIVLGPVAIKRGFGGVWFAELNGKEVADDRSGNALGALVKALQPPRAEGTALHSGAVEVKGTDRSWIENPDNWTAAR